MPLYFQKPILWSKVVGTNRTEQGALCVYVCDQRFMRLWRWGRMCGFASSLIHILTPVVSTWGTHNAHARRPGNSACGSDAIKKGLVVLEKNHQETFVFHVLNI